MNYFEARYAVEQVLLRYPEPLDCLDVLLLSAIISLVDVKTDFQRIVVVLQHGFGNCAQPGCTTRLYAVGWIAPKPLCVPLLSQSIL